MQEAAGELFEARHEGGRAERTAAGFGAAKRGGGGLVLLHGDEVVKVREAIEYRPDIGDAVAAAERCARTLDQGQACACATRRARTGVRLPWRTAWARWSSSIATEPKRPCHRCPGPAMAGIDRRGVAPMGVARRGAQAVLALRHGNEVHVVGHQAPGDQPHPGLLRGSAR